MMDIWCMSLAEIFFIVRFFLDHTDLKKLKPGTDEMINAVLRLGQAKAQELNMV